MARRRKKKNTLKSLVNLIVLFFLLFIIIFLAQRFILPLWLERPVVEKVPDEVEVEPPIEIEEIEVVLYFSDEQAQFLIPEYRKITQNDNAVKQAVVELIKGPINNNLSPTVPKTARVNELYISDEIAYIDLSNEIIRDHSGGSTGELLTVYSIVMTLTSFIGIDKVQILVDGQSVETLIGHVDTSIPLERDHNWLRR